MIVSVKESTQGPSLHEIAMLSNTLYVIVIKYCVKKIYCTRFAFIKKGKNKIQHRKYFKFCQKQIFKFSYIF